MAIDLTQIEKTLKEIAEKAEQVSETAAAIPEPTPTFDVDTPTGEVDISQLDGIQGLRNDVRGLETRFASEKEAQEELIASLEPTPRALELQQELLTERQAGRAGQVAIRGQPIPQPLIGRQAEVLREQVELRELPLIEELKLEVQKQQTVFEKAKAKLGFETAGIERVLDLEKEFRQMDRTQRQDARGLLEGIIGSLEGMAFEDLSPEQQTMLEEMITNAGVSPEVIKAGMANAKRIAQERAVEKPTTQRKLFEELVSEGLFKNTPEDYKRFLEERGVLKKPVKETAIEELRNDIAQAVISGDFGVKYKTREELIKTLSLLYRDLSEGEIATEIYAMIPDVDAEPVQETKSFFERLFKF